MEESRTQKMLDDLADLFLTDTVPAVSAKRSTATAEETKPTDAPESSVDSPAVEPSSKSPRNTVIEQLDGPEPIRLQPKTRLGLTLVRSSESTKVGSKDDKASPDLGIDKQGQDQTGDRSVEHHPKAVLEAVFLGNLPGFSGPWLRQYARFQAERHGLVAVLQMVDDDRIDLELVRPTAEGAIPGTSGLDVQMSPLEVIDRLADPDKLAVRYWLVHLPTPTWRGALRSALQMNTWTLLCGADDAAIVDAYRMLKHLVEATKFDDRAHQRHIQFMMMGSDKPRSVAAAGKLCSAISSFLHAPVEFVGYQKQMVPVHLQVLGSYLTHHEGNGGGLSERIIASLLELAGQPTTTGPIGSQGDEDTAPFPREQMLEEPLEETLVGSTQRPERPQEAELVELAELAELAEGGAQPEPEPDQVQTGAKELAEGPVRADDPDLLAFLGPGVIALEARCSHHPKTQLVLDEEGRLHLLRHHRAATGDDLRGALVDLIDVRRWVHEHIDLIRLTQRQCRFDAAAEPELHLFSDDAKTAVALVGRVGEFVKLHLLKQSRGGDAATWNHTGLN